MVRLASVWLLCLCLCVWPQAPAAPIVSYVIEIDGIEEHLLIHRKDDHSFFADALCERHGMADCGMVVRALLGLVSAGRAVHALPFTHLPSLRTHRLNITVLEMDSVSTMAERWCLQDMGFSSPDACTREWTFSNSDLPLLYVSGLVTADTNLGDISGFLIMRHFARQHGIHTLKTLGVGDGGAPCVLVVGSLLNWVADNSPCTVLGAGLISDPRRIPGGRAPYGLDLRAVRGPLSAAVLDVTGQTPYSSDPGLLLPVLFPRGDFVSPGCAVDGSGCAPPLREVGFIIHAADREAFFGAFPQHRGLLIDNHQPLMTSFLLQLFQYKRVLSSSLHGVIFAHAYGIPAAVVQLSGDILGGNFKYADYFRSVGHSQFTFRPTLADVGPELTLEQAAAFVDGYWQPDPADVAGLRDRLGAAVHTYLKELKAAHAYEDPIENVE